MKLPKGQIPQESHRKHLQADAIVEMLKGAVKFKKLNRKLRRVS